MPKRTPEQHSKEIFSDTNTVIGVMPGDTGSLDAFGRQRVTEPETLFDSSFEYDLQPLLWDTKITGGADIQHDATRRAAILTVSGSVAGTAILQTFAYHTYQKGKSQRVITTTVLGNPAEGITRRIGYLDGADGVYLEQTNAGLFFCMRSSTGETSQRIAQASWSEDALDGAGDSGIAIYQAKRQIIDIDVEWLGSGRIRYGFNINGMSVYGHYENNANAGTLAGPYMRSGTLPIRYEIVNDGTGAAAELVAICATVFSEGGFEVGRGFPYSANRGTTGVSVSTRRPVLSIRPKATFNGITNRGQINPKNITVRTTTAPVLVEVVYDGIVFATGGYVSPNAHSMTEYDISATVISGGYVIHSFIVDTTGVGGNVRGSGGIPLTSKLPMTLDIDGLNPINLSVVCTGIGGTASVLPTIDWDEVR